MLLVIVIDLLHGLDTWVLIALVVFPRRLLVPVEDLSVISVYSGRYLESAVERAYSTDER